MKKIIAAVLACFILGAAARPAAADAVVGVNTVDVGKMSQAQQSALLSELAAANVKNIRVALDAGAAPFIAAAFHQGIGTDAIVLIVGNASHMRPAEKAAGLGWAVAPLSAQYAPGMAQQFAILNQLDSAGVKLTALEYGNEINNPSFNGDFSAQGSGRVFDKADIESASTPETAAVKAGYLAYLDGLKQLKQWRDASSANKQTPLLSAGLADPGLPGDYPKRKLDGAAIAGTINFLRAHGLDDLVDGYGVHVYPSNDPHESEAKRAATLQKDTFSVCTAGGKPCWLTEWGFTNKSKSCPLDDTKRAGIISMMHDILGQFVSSGQLRGAFYYSWSGHLGVQESPEAIYRCGALTQAGVQALEPF